MSTSTNKMVLQLTDSQVKLLAQAARMGLPEMFVRLSMISVAGKVALTVLNSVMPARKGPPEIHFTQNIYGEDLDTEKISEKTQEFLTRDKVVLPEVVESESVEESAGGQELPKATFDIPQQPRVEDQG